MGGERVRSVGRWPPLELGLPALATISEGVFKNWPTAVMICGRNIFCKVEFKMPHINLPGLVVILKMTVPKTLYFIFHQRR